MDSNGKPFKVWAFYVLHLVILAVLSFYVVLFAWLAARNGLAGIFERVGVAAFLPLFFFGSLFVLFLTTVLFSRIKVDKEGIIVQSPFAFGGGLLYGFDELQRARWRMGGKAISFSGSAMGYWIIPFKHKELAAKIENGILTTPETATPLPRIGGLDYAVLCGPVLVLALLVRVLRLYGFSLNPLIQGAAWAIAASFSAYCFAYRTWRRFKIDNLGRRDNAIAYGLLAGVLVFVIAFLLFTQ